MSKRADGGQGGVGWDECFKVVSLFSGAMGLDIGIESDPRFKILCCVEKDEKAVETIELNRQLGNLRNPDMLVYRDIKDLEPEDLLKDLGLKVGDVNLIIGGPPCQSFSTAGRRGTIQDPRGALVWDFLRFVKGIRPDYFLMENVRGLLSAGIKHRPIAKRDDAPLSPEEQPGSVVSMLLKDYEAIGYRLDIFEVNAVNYGAPQLRERVLFIGNKYGLETTFPQPTHVPPDEYAALAHQQRLFDPINLMPHRTLRDALEGLVDPEPEVLDFSPRKKGYLVMVPEGGNWRALPEEMQKESMGKAYYAKGGRSGWWRRLGLDVPCPCLLTMPNHASTSLCHPSEIRALSVREYARIQEFPDEWQFAGDVADKYKQIGNAVPVRLGKVSAAVLAEALSKIREKKLVEISPTDQMKESRITYIRSHVRTKRWFCNGEAVVGGNQY